MNSVERLHEMTMTREPAARADAVSEEKRTAELRQCLFEEAGVRFKRPSGSNRHHKRQQSHVVAVGRSASCIGNGLSTG